MEASSGGGGGSRAEMSAWWYRCESAGHVTSRWCGGHGQYSPEPTGPGPPLAAPRSRPSETAGEGGNPALRHHRLHGSPELPLPASALLDGAGALRTTGDSGCNGAVFRAHEASSNTYGDTAIVLAGLSPVSDRCSPDTPRCRLCGVSCRSFSIKSCRPVVRHESVALTCCSCRTGTTCRVLC